jgi:hypothetical protein
MDNKDLIKQYVDTGLRLPEYQISKLSPNLLQTYFRKRLIAVGKKNKLEIYEINKYEKFIFGNLSNHEDIIKEIRNAYKEMIDETSNFNINLYQAVSGEYKLKIIKFLLQNNHEISLDIYNSSPEDIKEYYFDRVMNEGPEINISFYLGLSDEDKLKYLKSLIINKRTYARWYRLMPNNLKVDYLNVFIEYANKETKWLEAWVQEEYKEITGIKLIRINGKYKKNEQ